MTQVAEKLQPWLAAIDQRPQGGPRWLQDLRDRGAARFSALGFPTVRDEEWRFTNVAPIAAAEFRPTGGDAAHATEDELSGYLYSDAAHRIVIVNGRFVPELSRAHGLPAGVRVGSLAAAVTEQADVVQRYLGQLADFGTKAFTALNTALASDGAYVYIPDGVVLEQPLHLLFVTTASATSGPIMSNVRALIVAGDRSQSRIVETYVGPRGSAYFTNAVTEVFAGENAVVDHYKVQQESVDAFHVASMHVHAARSSNFSSHSFSLGGKLVRNDVSALLDGEGAECTLNGLYLADGDRLVDNHTSIDHAKAHCPSHEIYKGILGGKARAVFNGKIIVRPGRAEDRRQADQPCAAALRQRLDQHEAAARDFCRRREVHARRGDRAARRGRDLLPARPGPDVFRGARHADPCVCRRHSRPRQGGTAARGARRRALRAAGEGPRGD